MEDLGIRMEKIGLVKSSFWRGRRVFVTGHTGFKGAWLSQWLLEMGAEVTGYALAPNTTPSLFESIDLNSCMRHSIGDIRDLPNLREVLVSAKPEVVFHLAAQSLVLEGYKSPRETYETNVMGTVNLLEICRNIDGIKTIINVTTDKVYENREWSWGYRETDHLGGHDPYSSSKACAEIATSSMRRSFFDEKKISLITCRAGNVFGGGDWCENRIIPDAMRAFSQKKALRLRNPFSIRPWQHVLEPLRAYLMLAERSFDFKTDFPKSWNIGPTESDAVPVKELIDLVCESWGPEARWEATEVNGAPHEARYLKLDCSLARSELNWLPIFDLKTGVRLAVEWYKRFYEKAAAKELSELMKVQIKPCVAGDL